ncbi:MAG: hypothetical protein QXJ19_02565 [Candidatus Bathyarchaeia archaeon]|nr:hypothetical protein [Candidatus Bathyarchaeota archaeon]
MARREQKKRRRNDPSKMLDEYELRIAKLTLKMTKEALKLSKKRRNLPYIV